MKRNWLFLIFSVCTGRYLRKSYEIMSNMPAMFVLLFRQHDMRISLSCFGTVPLADPQLSVVQEVLKTLTFSKSESFTVIPFTTNWTIHFIRYKKKRSYILDEKYLITVTSIKNTKPNQILEGQQITIDLGDVPEHTEVEV